MNEHATQSLSTDASGLTTPDAVRDFADIAGGRPGTPLNRPRRRSPVIVAGLLAGFVAAAALVAGPLAGAREVITGALLFGFAAGWALLAALSSRFTDRPQG